jgi:hypothetical protein
MRLLVAFVAVETSRGFLPLSCGARRSLACSAVDFDSLMDMDVVLYSEKDSTAKKRLGALQENGSLSPLSTWTTDPAFGTSVEFLVDEEDRAPGLAADQIVIHSIIPEDSLSYGSRQVGGGMGPGNPHGEESELLYYVDLKVIGGDEVELKVNPDLEIFW